MRNSILLCYIFCLGYCSSPWYHPFLELLEPLLTKEKTKLQCDEECSTTLDCATGLSCFRATSDVKGCCLLTLKPNETGCMLDDQCKRACESTVCDTSQTPSRCLCDTGRHFLFNKCWKKCPDFAHREPVVDESGFSTCKLKTDMATAANFMRRQKRQLRRNFC